MSSSLKRLSFLALLFFAGLVAAEPRVAASNYPLAYFAERISGDPALVLFPEIEGDPAFWEPKLDDILQLQKARVILLNGAGYESWATTISLPASRTINTSAALGERLIEVPDAVTHSHGADGDHSHTSMAFTTWLDFSLALAQAEAVYQALHKAGIGDAPTLEAGWQSLAKELDGYDRALLELASNPGDVALLGSHPIYQYLARRYRFDIESMHWEPDVFPPEDEWQALAQLRTRHPAQWMLWEAQPLPETERRLATMGVVSIVFDPCGNRPEEGDFASVMAANLSALGGALDRRPRAD